MDNSLIFVIIIMFYFCVIFPLQMRRYLQKRQQRLQSQRPQTINDSSYTRTVTYQNNGRNGELSSEQSVFGVSHTTPTGTESQREEEAAAARHLESEHRQQIIDIQREIEQQAIRRREERDLNAPHLPPRIINSSTAAEYSQQIIDMQREIEQEAIRRREERRSNPNGPHMPPRLINSSTIRSSIYTITSGSTIGVSNPSVNYPYAPPLTPDADGITHIRFPDRSNSKDDELPSYDQAVAFDSTTTSVTIRRF